MQHHHKCFSQLTDQSPENVGVKLDPIPVESNPVVSASPITPTLNVPALSSSHEPDVGISVSTSMTPLIKSATAK